MIIKYFQKLESTNLSAKEMIKDGQAEHGLVIAAHEQTGGRGREGKSFFSPAGGLYMSVVLDNKEADASALTALAAVCVCRAIEKFTQKAPVIKWVNDVFIDGLKVCGILTEAAGEKYILGIGVNFSFQDLPDDLKNIAGAIGSDIKKDEFMKYLVDSILDNRLSNKEIFDEYKRRLMGVGRMAEVFGITGIIEGIGDSGELILRVGNEQKAIYAGSLRFL